MTASGTTAEPAFASPRAAQQHAITETSRDAERAPCRCQSERADLEQLLLHTSATGFRWSDWTPRIAMLNAPRENGAHLIEPPPALAGDMAAANARALAASDYDAQGTPLAQLSHAAKNQLRHAAATYTRGYRDVDPSLVCGNDRAVFLAGHQPEMFHPGVWYKNFALARIAQQHGAVPINLVIDSDTMKSSSLRIPTVVADCARVENVPFDKAAATMPFEQRAIGDAVLWNSFGTRAAKVLAPLVPESLLSEYWPAVIERGSATGNVGAALSQARHQLEGSWGTQTLETPQSTVCDLPAMRWFVAHLLAHLPRLWEVYNTSLHEYRREHKVRSSAHPVPELIASGDWLEAPLWVWSAADPRRRRLFVKAVGDELLLTDRAGWEAALSITPESSADNAVEQLATIAAQGVRIRTRALVTTLAARVLLGDLFLHGIGGAKYDGLTDRIIERFFGLAPPCYLVVSGTLHLPVARQRGNPGELAQLRARLRELNFHPERFIASVSPEISVEMQAIIAEKQRWIAVPSTPHNAKDRCRAIRAANEALQPAVENLRAQWTADAEELARALRCEAILTSRSYAFPLFPNSILTNFLLDEPLASG